MFKLEDEAIELLIYENKQMGDFLELLGLEPNEIISYVINGTNDDQLRIIKQIKDNLWNLNRSETL